MAKYVFAFRSSYRGQVDYTAWIDGAEHRLCLRDSACGPVLRAPGETVSAELLAEFNAWRAARHAEQIAYMQTRPEIYTLTADTLAAPVPARA